MSHPNGEQADPIYAPAATSQPPSSFHESAVQFTATAATSPVPAAQAAPNADLPQAAPYAGGVPQTAPYAGGVPQTAPYAGGVPQTAPYAGGVPQTAPYAGGVPAGTSAFPVTGVPVSAYPMVMEPKKKRTGMIVLTVVTIVLGLATAGLGAMYLLEYGKRTQADTKVSEQTAELAAADQRIKEIESKLSTSKEENAKLTQDLTGAKNKTDEVTKARDALAGCFQAIDTYAGSRTAANAKEVDAKCSEASKYY